MSKWGLLCEMCNLRVVTMDVAARREFRRSYYYSHGRKDELDAMTPDEINSRKPVEYMEPVWVLPPVGKVLCRECAEKKQKKGLSV